MPTKRNKNYNMELKKKKKCNFSKLSLPLNYDTDLMIYIRMNFGLAYVPFLRCHCFTGKMLPFSFCLLQSKYNLCFFFFFFTHNSHTLDKYSKYDIKLISNSIEKNCNIKSPLRLRFSNEIKLVGQN